MRQPHARAGYLVAEAAVGDRGDGSRGLIRRIKAIDLEEHHEVASRRQLCEIARHVERHRQPRASNIEHGRNPRVLAVTAELRDRQTRRHHTPLAQHEHLEQGAALIGHDGGHQADHIDLGQSRRKRPERAKQVVLVIAVLDERAGQHAAQQWRGDAEQLRPSVGRQQRLARDA